MRIAIDISPLEGKHSLQHRIRGTGFYLLNLKKSLLKYCPGNEYIFFVRGEKLPGNIDLVHYPYFEPFFLTLPFFNKHKSIVTVHDLTPLVFPNKFQSGIKGRIKWEIQKIALKNSCQIISDSNSSKKDIVKYAGIFSEKINVVYLASGEEFKKLDLSFSEKEKIRDKYNLPSKFLLYVGDATWNKNLPRFLKSVLKTGINLVLVGKSISETNFDKNNPWNQDLVEIQKEILNKEKIKALGFVETTDLVKIYNMATVFIMPSLYEGFGLPILEAMKCGCPVITSKNGSLEEVAGEAAFYVEPLSIENMAEGIEKVFNSEDLRQSLATKGYIQVQKFSWKKTASETLKAYEKAI